MNRKVGYGVASAVAATGVGLALASGVVTWPYKVVMVVIALLLAGLPWIARSRGVFGPAADGLAWVRIGGYLAFSALVLVVVGVLRFKTPVPSRPIDPGFSQTGEDIQLSILFLAVVAVYAVPLLLSTARRSRMDTRTKTLAAGAGLVAGVVLCALTPLGSVAQPAASWLAVTYRTALVLVVVAAPAVAGFLASRWRSRAGSGSGIWPGTVAGLLASGSAAVVLTVITLAGMLLFSSQVTPGVDDGPMGPPWSIERTVSSATGTLLFMVMPAALLVGLAVGAVAGVLGGARQGNTTVDDRR